MLKLIAVPNFSSSTEHVVFKPFSLSVSHCFNLFFISKPLHTIRLFTLSMQITDRSSEWLCALLLCEVSYLKKYHQNWMIPFVSWHSLLRTSSTLECLSFMILGHLFIQTLILVAGRMRCLNEVFVLHHILIKSSMLYFFKFYSSFILPMYLWILDSSHMQKAKHWQVQQFSVTLRHAPRLFLLRLSNSTVIDLKYSLVWERKRKRQRIQSDGGKWAVGVGTVDGVRWRHIEQI